MSKKELENIQDDLANTINKLEQLKYDDVVLRHLIEHALKNSYEAINNVETLIEAIDERS